MQWLRHYATSRKVADSRLSEVNEFFFNFLNPYGCTFTQSLTQMNTRNRQILFLWSRARPVRRVDNLAAICEPIV
jgi:hypothetical protein